MIRLPPRSTRTDTLLPYTTLFRSLREAVQGAGRARRAARRDRPRAQGPVRRHRDPGGLTMTDSPAFTPLRSVLYMPSSNAKARSEEHTSELQSLMRISYAVFCLKKKNHNAERNANISSTHDI